MRIALFAALTVVAVPYFSQPANATEGPWCAVVSIGRGAMYEDCQYATFEQCRPNVLAGNRGYCNLNPRYAGNWPGYAQEGKSRSKRRAQQY